MTDVAIRPSVAFPKALFPPLESGRLGFRISTVSLESWVGAGLGHHQQAIDRLLAVAGQRTLRTHCAIMTTRSPSFRHRFADRPAQQRVSR